MSSRVSCVRRQVLIALESLLAAFAPLSSSPALLLIFLPFASPSSGEPLASHDSEITSASERRSAFLITLPFRGYSPSATGSMLPYLLFSSLERPLASMRFSHTLARPMASRTSYLVLRYSCLKCRIKGCHSVRREDSPCEVLDHFSITDTMAFLIIPEDGDRFSTKISASSNRIRESQRAHISKAFFRLLSSSAGDVPKSPMET